MKVIIQGVIIETSFIISIEKRWEHFEGCAKSEFSVLDLSLLVFPSSYITLSVGCTKEYYSNEDSKNDFEKLENEANRMIKFLEDHSDKPNWPYPKFE